MFEKLTIFTTNFLFIDETQQEKQENVAAANLGSIIHLEFPPFKKHSDFECLESSWYYKGIERNILSDCVFWAFILCSSSRSPALSLAPEKPTVGEEGHVSYFREKCCRGRAYLA